MGLIFIKIWKYSKLFKKYLKCLKINLFNKICYTVVGIIYI